MGTTRTLVHSEERKAQDRIIEVGVKPSISNSKDEEPAPVNEVPEFKGGVNFVEAAVNEVLEFKGGSNFVEEAVNDSSKYTGKQSTVGNQEAPVREKAEHPVQNLANNQNTERKALSVKANQNSLPETGERESDIAIFLAGVSLTLSAALLTTKRKED